MAAKKARVHRIRLLKIKSSKFCDIWQNFYFHRILNNEDFKVEGEQVSFVTHLITTVQLYYWLSKNRSFKTWSNKFQMVMINYTTVSCVQVYRKSNGWILCKPFKSEILMLYSIVHVAVETTKSKILPINQNLSSVYFSSIFAKLQLVSWTFLLPWFGKWHTITNCQNCVQLP